MIRITPETPETPRTGGRHPPPGGMGVLAARFPVVYLPVGDLRIDPGRFQFKADADGYGVVLDDQLRGDYRELGTGAIIAWEDKNGAYWVVDGHHRYDLARRTRKEDIPAQVIREIDGYPETAAIALAAEVNILNGTGTVADYARYFRNRFMSREEAEGKGLLAREKGRLGWEIGRHAADSVYLWFLGHPDPNEAKIVAAVALAAPDNPGLQDAGLGFYLEDGAEALEVGLFIRGLKSLPRGQGGQSQPDLFGMEDFLATEKALASEAARIIRDTRRCQDILRQAITRKGRLELTDEEAARWGITDKADEDQIQAAYERVRQDLLEWGNYRLHADKLRELSDRIGDAPETITASQTGIPLRPLSPARPTRPVISKNISDEAESPFQATVFRFF